MKSYILLSFLILTFTSVLCNINNQLVCEKICVECSNPDQISILQKGKCLKECDPQKYQSLQDVCFSFPDNSIIVSSLEINKSNQVDFLTKPLTFNNWAKVSIYNITISYVDLPLNKNSVIPFIIGIYNVNNVVISQIEINNNSNLPSIMRVQQVNEQMYFQRVNVLNTSFKDTQSIFQMIDGKKLMIINISVSFSSLLLSQQKIIEEQNLFYKLENDPKYLEQWQSPIHASFIQTNGFQYVHLENSKFNNNTRISMMECYDYFFSSQYMSLLTKNQTYVQILLLSAYSNSLASVYKGNTKEIFIQKSTFVSNYCVRCKGSSISLTNAIKLQISQSAFFNNTALDGGAAYLNNCKCPDTPASCISIQASSFDYNQAKASGGALMLENSDINFDESKIGSKFQNNKALIGGAIRYIKYLPYFFQKYSTSSLFNINYNDNPRRLSVFNNHGVIYGRNIGSYARDFKIDYVDPKELVDDRFEANTNMLKKLENSTLLRSFEISNIRSGQIVNMRIVIFDEELFPIVIDPSQKYPLSIQVEVEKYTVTVYRTDSKSEIVNIFFQFKNSLYQLPNEYLCLNYLGYKNIPQNINEKYKMIMKKQQLLMNFKQQEGNYHMRYDTIKNGIFTFDNLRIYSPPGQHSQVLVSTDIIKIPSSDYNYDMLKDFTMSVKINYRRCKQGEIYQKYNNGTILWCEPCDFGKYSLDYPQEDNPKQICKLCPQNTVGCLQNLIVVGDGFWRPNENSDIISECYNKKENCIGQNQKNRFTCQEGHIGPLCESCDITGKVWGDKYIQNSNYSCQKCKERGPTEIIWAVFQLFLIFGYHIIAIQTTYNMNLKILLSDYLRKFQMLSISKSAIQDETPFYIKCLTNYILIYSAINKVSIEFLESAMEAPKIFAFPIDNFKDQFDCYIASFLDDNNFPLIFAKMSYGSFIQYIFVIVYIGIQKIGEIFSKKNSQSAPVFNGFIYFTIFFLPSNIKIIMAGLFCRQVGTENYLKADMNYYCYSYEHITFLPFIIIAFSSFCVIETTNARLSYGFLFVGYKAQYYWWELIRIVIRVIIIVIVSTQTYEGTTFINTAVFIIALLTLYFICMIRCQPHDRDKFNKLELKSSGILISILIINIFIKNSANSVLENIGKITIVSIHISFLVYLIFVILFAKMQAMYCEEYNGFKGYLKRKLPKLFGWLEFETINHMRVYNNWKKLYRAFGVYKLKSDYKSQLFRKKSKFYDPKTIEHFANHINQYSRDDDSLY